MGFGNTTICVLVVDLPVETVAVLEIPDIGRVRRASQTDMADVTSAAESDVAVDVRPAEGPPKGSVAG